MTIDVDINSNSKAIDVYGSVHGSADYGKMNVMYVLNGLEFFERLLNLIQYAKDLVVYGGEDRLSLLFLD